jgi:hypothetical protein
MHAARPAAPVSAARHGSAPAPRLCPIPTSRPGAAPASRLRAARTSRLRTAPTTGQPSAVVPAEPDDPQVVLVHHVMVVTAQEHTVTDRSLI